MFAKKQKFFPFFFWDSRPKSQILTPHPRPPPFENFSLDALKSELKPSVKKLVDRPVRNRSTSRSTGVEFEIYRSGRVEKILTDSISELYLKCGVGGQKQWPVFFRLQRIFLGGSASNQDYPELGLESKAKISLFKKSFKFLKCEETGATSISQTGVWSRAPSR